MLVVFILCDSHWGDGFSNSLRTEQVIKLWGVKDARY